MQLVVSWKSSFLLLRPSNMKLFGLVVGNAFVKAWKVLFSYWGWLAALMVLIEAKLVSGRYMPLYYAGLKPFFVFIMYLALRPSVKRKTYAYFFDYAPHLIWFASWYGFWTLLATVVKSSYAEFCVVLPLACMPLFLKPIFSYQVTFLLDSSGSFRQALTSFWLGIKLFVLNVPFSLVVFMLFYVLHTGLSWAMGTYRGVGDFALWSLALSVYTNFCLKRMYDNGDVYSLV